MNNYKYVCGMVLSGLFVDLAHQVESQIKRSKLDGAPFWRVYGISPRLDHRIFMRVYGYE